MMQLGLRFAAAKLPGLRSTQVVGSLVVPSEALMARRADPELGDSAFAGRQVRCIINKAARWSHSYIRE